MDKNKKQIARCEFFKKSQMFLHEEVIQERKLMW